MGKKKSEHTAEAEGNPENSFSGHIVSLQLGEAVQFEMAGKKGKRRTCKLDRAHPLFGLVAETVTQAYWVDRKVTVSGNCASEELDVKAIQVGSFGSSPPTVPAP